MSHRTTLVGIVLIAGALSLAPFALVARSRARQSPALAIHMVLDMDKQPKLKAQRPTELFADGRVMRPRMEGTLAREDLTISNEAMTDPKGLRMVDGDVQAKIFASEEEYIRVTRGQEKAADGKPQFVARIPVAVTRDLLLRGQERFNIYCAPCHGYAGYGNGPVAQRAAELQAMGSEAATDWRPPTDYHKMNPANPQDPASVPNQPDGQIFNTITNGVRMMPRYDKQISIMDRWAIVAYVRALELQQKNNPSPTTQPARLSAAAAGIPAAPGAS